MEAAGDFLIAAICTSTTGEADDLVFEFATTLKNRGLNIRGLAQQTKHEGATCELLLVDIHSGDTYPITQDLGACSTACRLDTQALSEASIVLRLAQDESPDLVIANRFGKQEAEGRGFAAEMLQLMSMEIPLLTIVQEKYLGNWREFTGGLSLELQPDAKSIQDWFLNLQKSRSAT